jgi:hypothetical protein
MRVTDEQTWRSAQRSPRATSPAPGSRISGSHRRDRSQTRFPVNTSSPTETRRSNGTNRGSLEVPGSDDSPTHETTPVTTNGTTEAAPAPATAPVEHPAPSSTRVPFPRKHAGSLTRGNRDSTGSLRSDDTAPRGVTIEETPAAPRGVTLEDKPMDD